MKVYEYKPNKIKSQIKYNKMIAKTNVNSISYDHDHKRYSKHDGIGSWSV